MMEHSIRLFAQVYYIKNYKRQLNSKCSFQKKIERIKTCILHKFKELIRIRRNSIANTCGQYYLFFFGFFSGIDRWVFFSLRFKRIMFERKKQTKSNKFVDKYWDTFSLDFVYFPQSMNRHFKIFEQLVWCSHLTTADTN